MTSAKQSATRLNSEGGVMAALPNTCGPMIRQIFDAAQQVVESDLHNGRLGTILRLTVLTAGQGDQVRA